MKPARKNSVGMAYFECQSKTIISMKTAFSMPTKRFTPVTNVHQPDLYSRSGMMGPAPVMQRQLYISFAHPPCQAAECSSPSIAPHRVLNTDIPIPSEKPGRDDNCLPRPSFCMSFFARPLLGHCSSHSSPCRLPGTRRSGAADAGAALFLGA